MHCGDDGNRQCAPTPHDVLKFVRNPVGAFGQPAGVQAGAAIAGHAAETLHVEPGAKRAALAGENDGAKTFLGRELGQSSREGVKHGGVERIHLVRPGEPDVGDAG